jgi:hypothetical protein
MSSGFWGMLHDRDAGSILNGHAHRYERFAARIPGGRRSAEGIDRSSPGDRGRRRDHPRRRPELAGSAYDSLAIALAFGLALAIVVASVGHVSDVV